MNNSALLEKQLTLASWFAEAVLGYEHNTAMLRSLKDAGEGWGMQYNKVLERWLSEEKSADTPHLQELQELDAEIRADWNVISERRGGNLSLKYFQYLSLLASGLFLRLLAEKPGALLEELQRHAEDNENLQNIPSVHTLRKLAFWMATGSGKTLLMHMHYRQFLRHKQGLFVPDNILLVTPNEQLSRQHISEMRMSGIPCFRHGDSDVLLHTAPDAVRVIEITKLMDKDGARIKGGGESVHVEEFSGQNLVFVDEGHKGAGGDVWFELRRKLVSSGDKSGFVLEYSATFGQALNAELLTQEKVAAAQAQEHQRAQEYARCILFNYSYRYFHNDGYGKAFFIRGIQTDPANEKAEDLLMLGNLLTFFEQQWVYEKHGAALAAYNIEKPLLLLLGRSVTSSDKATTAPSVVKLITFLARVTADKDARGKAWLEGAVEQLLSGRSAFSDGTRDLFSENFSVLKQKKHFPNAKAVIAQLLHTFFYARAAGGLRFSLLKQAKGEAVLRVGENPPFALVYVGDVNALAKLMPADRVQVDSDAVQSSLFVDAHAQESTLNALIGARKFMEGWSSWRVSGMGLLDLAKSEGTEVLQLFGRGVRLLGRECSLKRSTPKEREAMSSKTLAHALTLLEKFNIFAIRARFMEQFREYLSAEGAEEEIISIKIKIGTDVVSGKDLQSLRFPPSEQFKEIVELTYDEGIAVKLDYGVKTELMNRGGVAPDGEVVHRATEAEPFPEELMPLLDFDALYRRLLEYKYQQGRSNLILRRDELEDVLRSCQLVGADEIFAVDSAAALRRLQEVAFAALSKYSERLYVRRQKQWETKHMSYMPLFGTDQQPAAAVRESFTDYEVRVSKDDEKRLKLIKKLQQDIKKLHKQDEYGEDGLKRVCLDRHLYVPILLEDQGISISPPGLVPSEKRFVTALRKYLHSTAAKAHLREREIFLLRNGGRGKGIGFYEDEGFFPDFILWVKHGEKQRIIFVEPHGMMHAALHGGENFKARLWEQLQEMTHKLQQRKAWRHISVDSYIISETKYEVLKKRYEDGNWSKGKFANHHILFAEDKEKAVEHIITAEAAGAHPPPRKAKRGKT